MRDCIPSASGYGEAISDEHRAVDYFYEFIRKFASQLFDEYTDNTDLSPLQRLIRVFSGNRDVLDSLVLDIHEIAEYTPLRKVPVKSTETRGINVSATHEGGIAASIGIESNPESILPTYNGNLEVGSDACSQSGSSTEESVDYVFESARRYQPLRKKLEEMMRAVDVKHLYVLIDEWADINRLRDDKIQAFFAELLRKTFGGSSLITIKIASIKGVANFNEWRPQGGIGLELGADIFVACDLDQVYCSEENAFAFYAEMMFKRLCKVDSRVKQYSQTNELGEFLGKPPEGFFSYIFKDEKSLIDLVHGSGRIPRDFIQLFCYCAHEKQFGISPKWRKGELLKLIKDHSIRTKDEVVGASAGRSSLFTKIIDVVKNTGSRVFLIRKECNEETRAALTELYNFRLVHPMDASKVPSFLRRKYNCYYADFGYFLEAYGEFELRKQEATCPIELDGSQDFTEYVVELSQKRQQSIICVHCTNRFSATERSYYKKGLCPGCFNFATVEEKVESRAG
ncbi:hypothetical protein AB833_10035 [Chromatiales bacterium (ex Bugula neritina AB1)]|nr:hypothetical protein AB833_10035 [Chromatiales bacterium (ex Bugula neritina AB1)]